MSFDYDQIVNLFEIKDPVAMHILRLFSETPEKQFVRKELCKITGSPSTTVWDNLQKLIKVELVGSKKERVNKMGTTSRIFFINDKTIQVIAEET